MKRHLRRILSLALLALLLVSAVPLSPAVAEGPFVIDDGVLTAYNGPGGNVRIPRGVTEIGAGVFQGRIDLRTVTIPRGVTKIGNDAFNGCANLTHISIPNGVTQIGAWAFADCVRLTAVSVPKGVLAIEAHTFRNCAALKAVSIPNSVTTIGDGAFLNCKSLARVTIPEGVTEIGNHAFEGCANLTHISVPGTVNIIRRKAFFGCHRLARVDIGNGVRVIVMHAFAECRSLTDVELPNSIEEIGAFAFENCIGLSSITIPESTWLVWIEAFGGCPNLRVATIPNNRPHWSMNNIFQGSRPEILYLPDNLLPPAIFLKVGQTITLPKFRGAKVEWSIEGNPVATVSKTNKIRGVTVGEATLKLKVLAAVKGKELTLDGQPLMPNNTHAIPLKVFDKRALTAQNVVATPKKMTLHPAGTENYRKKGEIVPTFTPTNLPDADEWAQNCTYVSSNPKVAQVDMQGTVYAVRPGRATVTVYAPNMKSAKVSVAVEGFITDIRLKNADGDYVDRLTLNEGEGIWLIPEFNADAAYTALRWISSKPAVADVDGEGDITALSKGTAKITAIALDGSGKRATVTVMVEENLVG